MLCYACVCVNVSKSRTEKDASPRRSASAFACAMHPRNHHATQCDTAMRRHGARLEEREVHASDQLEQATHHRLRLGLRDSRSMRPMHR
jgi:hypothetical protein